jgi:hypothetical protein
MVCKSSLYLSWLLHKNIKGKMRIYATTTFNWHSKNIENWGGTENLDFCSGYKAFSKPTKDVFRVQGAWQSSNTLSTMVHGQVSHIIIIWHTPPPPQIDRAHPSLYPPPGEPSPVPSWKFLTCHCLLYFKWSWWFMVLNATFNNISVISWRSVLLVEETRVPGENRPVVSHW